MVYGIVKSHNAFIDVESQLGRGTTFRLYFPVSNCVEQPILDEMPEKNLPAEPMKTANGHKTILVAEDEEKRPCCEINSMSLKGAGFTDSSILVAMQDESEQQIFAEETQAQAITGEEIPGLPDLSSGQVLIMVEAEERAENALNILNRNHAVTGGIRIRAA